MVEIKVTQINLVGPGTCYQALRQGTQTFSPLADSNCCEQCHTSILDLIYRYVEDTEWYSDVILPVLI